MSFGYDPDLHESLKFAREAAAAAADRDAPMDDNEEPWLGFSDDEEEDAEGGQEDKCAIVLRLAGHPNASSWPRPYLLVENYQRI